jgi:hypothetical protein
MQLLHHEPFGPGHHNRHCPDHCCDNHKDHDHYYRRADSNQYREHDGCGDPDRSSVIQGAKRGINRVEFLCKTVTTVMWLVIWYLSSLIYLRKN